MREERERAQQLLKTSRDELADIFKIGFRSMIVEADEWRPLADHVLDLVALALKYHDEEDPTARAARILEANGKRIVDIEQTLNKLVKVVERRRK